MPPDRAAAETAAPPPRPRRRSGAIAAIAVVAILAIVLAAGLARRGPRPVASPATSGEAPSIPASMPAAAARGYLVSLPELRDRAAAAAAGSEPEAGALRDLRAWADIAVTERPNPRDPLQISGTRGAFVDDTAAAYGLALAWGATGDLHYAEAAAERVMAWVRTTKTLRDACPDRGDCQTSLIVSRTAAGFVFAVDLLDGTGVMSGADVAAFDTWLRTVILPAASERDNNWGDAGVLLRVVATDHLGDAAGYAAAIAKWRSQLDLIAPDGHIPEEVRRGSSGLLYTQEALLYKLAVARIAERRGLDLWSVTGAGGGSLEAAVDLNARYLESPSTWPWNVVVDPPDPSPGWELAYAHWKDPRFAAILGPQRPYGADGHSAIRWTTLTNGVPLGG